jgi:hypothetical protein
MAANNVTEEYTVKTVTTVIEEVPSHVKDGLWNEGNYSTSLEQLF